jgi:hypothetical protein
VVQKFKELVKAKEILLTPNPKLGKILKHDTVKLVPEFSVGDGSKIIRCVPDEKKLHL